MGKIYLCGDVHGDFHPIHNFYEYLTSNNLPIKDITIVILGDFSGNYYLNRRDDKMKKILSSYPFNYFIIRGNHEERPSICIQNNPNKWHVENYWDNEVYVENNFPKIKYALDIPAKYIIPTANGKNIKVLTLPGAYSVDKYYRLRNGIKWFEHEQLSEDEIAAAAPLIASDTWDLVLSHTCPAPFEPTDLFLPTIDQSMVDKTMENWLKDVERSISYKLWSWGHYHANRIYPHFNNSDRLMLFNDCFCDIYKYFCGNYKIADCLLPIDNANIDNFY